MAKIETGVVKKLFGTVHLIWSGLFDTVLELHQDTRPPKGYGITVGWVFIGLITFREKEILCQCGDVFKIWCNGEGKPVDDWCGECVPF